jgi:hypothetical protein
MPHRLRLCKSLFKARRAGASTCPSSNRKQLFHKTRPLSCTSGIQFSLFPPRQWDSRSSSDYPLSLSIPKLHES